MLNKLVDEMKQKGFDVCYKDGGYLTMVFIDTNLGSRRVCLIYKSLKVESCKNLYEEEERELNRVRSFVSKFKKQNS